MRKEKSFVQSVGNSVFSSYGIFNSCFYILDNVYQIMNVRHVIRLFSIAIHFHRNSWTGSTGWDPQLFDSTWLINYSILSAVDWFLDINNKGNARVHHPFFVVTTCVSETLFILLGSDWLIIYLALCTHCFCFCSFRLLSPGRNSKYHPFKWLNPKLCTPTTTNSELNLLERSQHKLLRESIS